jgi:sterol desaturase/sphingolipid hydroxylase (fatty acid hydroxylase superfamily)
MEGHARMDWLVEIGQTWLDTARWVAGLGIAFAVLVWLMPCNRGMFWWKNPRGLVTDLIYWFIVPLFLSYAKTILLIIGVVLCYGGHEPEFLPVKAWPLWLQCPVILFLQDVMLYGIHRMFHSRLGWKFHSVHHSPRVLDWLSTMRTHPINYILEFTLADVVVLLLGFSGEALMVLAAFNTVYSSMVHANLNWTFGPLRYVLASPVFHRWHHTTLEAGSNKNFASTFPVLDLLFGTFYMPPGRLPKEFGNGECDFPEDFLGQLVYPFRKTQAPPPRTNLPTMSHRQKRVA